MPLLVDLPVTFTTGRALELGVHPRQLYTWRDTGEINELTRGVFRRADAPAATYPDLLAVAYRAPAGVVCLLTAASLHDLTDDIPPAVQIAVPRPNTRPRISYPPVEVFRFDAETFELGVESIEAAPGEPVRVYTAGRTVVDLMRLRRRIGEPTALIALRRYLSLSTSRPGELLELARALDVLGPTRAALDVLESA
jgi:predicted transcriptional regulator of viral defense system